MANEEHLHLLGRGLGVWNRWREENPNIRPNLRGADLNGRDLEEVDFRGAELNCAMLRDSHLSRSYLNGADLRRADLSGADLYRTDLSNAELTWADLSQADLTNADLRNSDLRRVKLHRAKLWGSRFNNATADGTIFTAVDLSWTHGLDEMWHLGPSEVSVSTLELSEGQISRTFLHRCGLTEWEIEAAKLYSPELLPAQTVDVAYKLVELRSDPLLQFYSCFISYSHADQSFARKLYNALQKKGVRCWLDAHQILPGDDLMEEVDRGIRLWDKVLLCCSQHSLTSWWVDNEINTAFDKEQHLMKARGKKTVMLIPLNLDNYLFSGTWQSGKRAQITSRLAADFTGWENDALKFDMQFERLVRAMRTGGAGRERPPVSKL